MMIMIFELTVAADKGAKSKIYLRLSVRVPARVRPPARARARGAAPPPKRRAHLRRKVRAPNWFPGAGGRARAGEINCPRARLIININWMTQSFCSNCATPVFKRFRKVQFRRPNQLPKRELSRCGRRALVRAPPGAPPGPAATMMLINCFITNSSQFPILSPILPFRSFLCGALLSSALEKLPSWPPIWPAARAPARQPELGQTRALRLVGRQT